MTLLYKYWIFQIDDDLKESKEAERKKNKQRLREKRKKREKGMLFDL